MRLVKIFNERSKITIRSLNGRTMYWYHTYPRYVQSNTINGRVKMRVFFFIERGPNPFLNVSIMQFQERRGNEGINGCGTGIRVHVCVCVCMYVCRYLLVVLKNYVTLIALAFSND